MSGLRAGTVKNKRFRSLNMILYGPYKLSFVEEKVTFYNSVDRRVSAAAVKEKQHNRRQQMEMMMLRRRIIK